MSYNNNPDIKYSRLCLCNSTSCSICGGTLIAPVGNISFSEMEVGVMYAVKIYGSEIGECKLKRWDYGQFSCSFVFIDSFGFISENSLSQSIVFRLEFLEELKQIDPTENDQLEPLITQLRNHPSILDYDLDTLASIVALGIYEALFQNVLRDYDVKYGNSLRSYVTVYPVPAEKSLGLYQFLCRKVTNSIRLSNVTLNWAIRDFEKEYGCSFIQTLLDAEKSYEQFMADAILYV